MRSVALLLALTACDPTGDGTAVGNPGQLDVYVENVPEGLRLDSAEFSVAVIELVSCDRDVAILQLDTVFDALGPSPVEIPAGEWCQTVVLPAGKGSFSLSGADADDIAFEIELSPEPFVLEGEYTIDGNQVVLSLSLADQASLLAGDDDGAEPAPISENDAGAPTPALVVAEGLFTDSDADGRGTDELRLAVAVEPTVDCGCANSSRPSAGLVLLGGLLGWGRRRAR